MTQGKPKVPCPVTEAEWSDAVWPPEEDDEDRGEPVYRDGTPQHECWAEPGYTADPDPREDEA